MAGTADSWKTDNIILGAGRIYANVAIPGGGGRITLDATTKTPDDTANPSAVHLGATQAGAKLSVTTQWQEFFVDEFHAPIVTNVEQVAMTLEGAFAGVRDTALLTLLTPGMGTSASGSGYAQMTFGRRAVAYTSVCIIAPRYDDPTRVVIAQLYKALNTTGFEASFARKELNYSPFNFKAYEVTSRAAADTLGTFWYEVA